jgi:hypothetical protein
MKPKEDVGFRASTQPTNLKSGFLLSYPTMELSNVGIENET